MDNIPADILTNAAAAVEAMPQRPPFKADVLSAIESAVLAERKRCEGIADRWANDDMQHGEVRLVAAYIGRSIRQGVDR